MWPIIMQFMRSNAAYITLPVAAVVGVIGYNLESLLSDRYTPYNSKYLFEYYSFKISQMLSLYNTNKEKKLESNFNLLWILCLHNFFKVPYLQRKKHLINNLLNGIVF